MALVSGTKIGRYEVRSKIGEGGMGEVYLVEDSQLHRHVALKVLTAELAAQSDRMRRFKQEASAAAALNHPNIAHIYEVGEDQGVHFIAMEFVDGITLRKLIHEQQTELSKLLRHLQHVAEGLAKAHAAGIVHRDLKPDNIMVSRDGHAKILDFGLAKLLEPAKLSGSGSSELATAIMAQHSTPGAVMGTVGYMSPEQAQGKIDQIDHRSDIFSFGCILYEAVTRQKAFEGKDAIDSLNKIIRETVAPISSTNPTAPADLQRIVRRCLTKDPEDRFQSIKDLAIEIKEVRRELHGSDATHLTAAPASSVTDAPESGARSVATSLSSPAPSTHPSSSEFVTTKIRSHKGAFLAGLAVILVVIVVGIVKLIGIGVLLDRIVGRKSNPVAPLQQMRFIKLPVTGGTPMNIISPDGKLIARVAKEGGKTSVRVRQTNSTAGGERDIVPLADLYYVGLTFAPDSASVYYVAGATNEYVNSLYRVPVIGGDPQKLIFDVDTPVTFSPDGKQLAFKRHSVKTNEDSLIVAGADGGAEQTILKEPASAGRFTNIAWSPDGQLIACRTANKDEQGAYSSIELVNVASRTTKPLSAQRWRTLNSLTWMTNGEGLVLSAVPHDAPPNTRAQLWHVSYPSGEPYQITNDPNGFAGLTLTADSHTALTGQFTLVSNVWVVPGADPSGATQVTNSAAELGTLDWMPDGRIVYASRASGNHDIWIMNADGTGNRQLTTNPENDNLPTACPDGRYIVFQSVRDRVVNLFRMNADGSGAIELVHNVDFQVFPQISPDSRWVYYTVTDRAVGKRVLMKVSIDGGEPVKVQVGPAYNRLSPDGQHFLGWNQPEEASEQIMFAVFAPDGSALRRIKAAADAQHIEWSPDGRAVDFIATRGVANVWRMAIEGGAEKQITQWKTDAPLYWFDWSRDGKSLAIVRDNSTTDLVLIQNFK